ncbi:helix-turn-helix transcriptional regulator [Cognatiyoonia sp. IB215446]|uniref:helix-turn-helix domain-containing protein n=1 Tax=Cognatiyoonia sp. IB215446 TaxID=3097355 RepID=UPI002A112DE6|nr:helix-turn-helix transcriptional regulator [Cognatiyoonia sp. IB215446]MDX8350449.1 helix-turn-helix transcriptional regulator [Cognatiyoonia sp. IB215446]
MAKTIHSEGHEALCAELIRIRRAEGMTQADLAAKLSCHQSMIARIESGQRRIDVVELIVLARALGSKAEDITNLVDSKTPKTQKL